MKLLSKTFLIVSLFFTLCIFTTNSWGVVDWNVWMKDIETSLKKRAKDEDNNNYKLREKYYSGKEVYKEYVSPITRFHCPPFYRPYEQLTWLLNHIQTNKNSENYETVDSEEELFTLLSSKMFFDILFFDFESRNDVLRALIYSKHFPRDIAIQLINIFVLNSNPDNLLIDYKTVNILVCHIAAFTGSFFETWNGLDQQTINYLGTPTDVNAAENMMTHLGDLLVLSRRLRDYTLYGEDELNDEIRSTQKKINLSRQIAQHTAPIHTAMATTAVTALPQTFAVTVNTTAATQTRSSDALNLWPPRPSHIQPMPQPSHTVSTVTINTAESNTTTTNSNAIMAPVYDQEANIAHGLTAPSAATVPAQPVQIATTIGQTILGFLSSLGHNDDDFSNMH